MISHSTTLQILQLEVALQSQYDVFVCDTELLTLIDRKHK